MRVIKDRDRLPGGGALAKCLENRERGLGLPSQKVIPWVRFGNVDSEDRLKFVSEILSLPSQT
jgi:hypothetical protein